MLYNNIIKGTFIKRINRFSAEVFVENGIEIVHVKNTGRCKELLKPNAVIYLQRVNSPTRKTKFDLISVIKSDGQVVNIDSQAPNYIVAKWLTYSGLFSKQAIIKKEVVYKNSRFDIYVEDKGAKTFIEVKGVTLEIDGFAYFPDAPTERGVKHINELADAVRNGYSAYVVFVVQMKGCKKLKPNDATHKAFADALRCAKKQGVKVLAVDCVVTANTIEIDDYIPVEM